MKHNGVCRTAPATPGLLNICLFQLSTKTCLSSKDIYIYYQGNAINHLIYSNQLGSKTSSAPAGLKPLLEIYLQLDSIEDELMPEREIITCSLPFRGELHCTNR